MNRKYKHVERWKGQEQQTNEVQEIVQAESRVRREIDFVH